jgi:hypothetical protein
MEPKWLTTTERKDSCCCPPVIHGERLCGNKGSLFLVFWPPPTGNTVIIVQPPTSPSSEDPDSQAPPVHPLPMPPLSSPASPAGAENPSETLPQSKWLVRDTSSFCVSSVCAFCCRLKTILHPALHRSVLILLPGLSSLPVWPCWMWHVRHHIVPVVPFASCIMCICLHNDNNLDPRISFCYRVPIPRKLFLSLTRQKKPMRRTITETRTVSYTMYTMLHKHSLLPTHTTVDRQTGMVACFFAETTFKGLLLWITSLERYTDQTIHVANLASTFKR